MSFHKYTYYQVLGLRPAVSSLEIKNAYRRLVKSHHPDVDYSGLTDIQRKAANERMAKLNEAYETLKDKSKRAAYDSLIGANGRGFPQTEPFQTSRQIIEQYLKQTFHPARQRITRILARYKKQLHELSQDIYDQKLVDNLERYTHELELVLSKSSQALTENKAPHMLSAAELMMRYGIAQAADGLEELKYFCSNYDYNHLAMADNLFREANNLLRQALHLAK